MLTFAEWEDGWRFDAQGRKDDFRTSPRVQARLEARFAVMRERMASYHDAERFGAESSDAENGNGTD